jgi:EAL domain-containing protein (putative c-di-GMP-specific phosphodiesterase class I)
MSADEMAKGVDRSQQTFLDAHGCEEGQDYLISRPMAASDTEALLRSNRLSPSFVREFAAIE